MVSALHVSPVLLWMAVVAMIFVIAYPLLVAGIVHKKLRVGWKYFWFGVLVFLVSQLLTRLPLVTVLQRTVFASLLRTSLAFDWTWLVILALTAGLFEEIGRYLGYRIFMGRETKTWSKAVMFGIGHESLEAIVLVGGQIALSLLSIVLLSAINLNSLPTGQRQSFIQQLATMNAQPVWLPLQAAWGRLWSVPLQVALSVLVLQVFRRQQGRWLFLAILFHALTDFLTGAIPQVFGANATSDLLVAGMLCVFGLLGLWIIWRLRESDDPAPAEKEIAPLS
jgi:uncharacterized membrane protein YhfC